MNNDNKEFFNHILQNPNRLRESYIKRNFEEKWKEILNWCEKWNINQKTFREKVWYYQNNIKKEKKCIICNKKVKFNNNYKKGYKKYCSSKCSKKHKRLNNSKYLERIKKKEINYLPIEEYITMRTPIKHKCLKCKEIIISKPYKILERVLSCSCSLKIINDSKYLKKLKENQITVKPLEKYKGSYTFINHQCLKCLFIFKSRPNYILNGNLCPNCNSSKGEKEVEKVLNQLNIDFVKEKVIKIKGKNLRFDFYLPKKGIYIEYDGIQHFKPIEKFGGKKEFRKIKKRDYLKNLFVKKLIRIPYWERKNIKEILKKLNF